jgi:PhnB protein
MSKQYLSPYVNFGGRAREAMEFYHRVLGGKLDMHTMDEKGATRAAGRGDRIAYARLEADGAVIVGSDGHPDYPATAGDNIGIALGGTDKARLTKMFHDLGAGGKIKMAPAPQPWGGETGRLTDMFGINWTVSINEA